MCHIDDSVTKKLLEIPFSTRIIAENLWHWSMDDPAPCLFPNLKCINKDNIRAEFHIKWPNYTKYCLLWTMEELCLITLYFPLFLLLLLFIFSCYAQWFCACLFHVSTGVGGCIRVNWNECINLGTW